MQGGKNGLVEASSKMDIHELRVFMTMLTMVLPEDQDFAEYELKTKDIIKLFSLGDDGRYYHAIRDAAARLFNKSFVLVERKDDGKDYKVTIHLLDETSEPIDEAEQNRIRVKFNPKLKPYLLQLKREYLTIDVRNVANLQSPHSLKLYIVLKHQFNLGNKKVSYTIDRLKEILALEEHEYPLYGNFKQKVIKKGIKDLDKYTDLKIAKIEEIKSGRAVQSVIFHLEGKISTEIISPLKVSKSSPKSHMEKRVGGSEAVLGSLEYDDFEPVDDNASHLDGTVADLLVSVRKYAAAETIQKWVDQYPIEQIQKGVVYALRQIKKGKVRNPGAYLQKMVATDNLIDSEQLDWDKEHKKKKISDLEAVKVNDRHLALDVLKSEAHELSLRIFLKLVEDKEDALATIVGKLKQGLFGTYFNDSLSLHQNLANPALSGIMVDIAKQVYPDSFVTTKEINESIRQLENELSS